jgi:Cu-Zn family superoxide dismutase
MRGIGGWAWALCATIGVAGCAAHGGDKQKTAAGAETGGAATSAVAELNPTQGNQARGTLTFTPVGGGLHVEGTITGLAPGAHGFHIHEVGDCSAPDGSSAGPHWNPGNMSHGSPEATVHHLGDLGNIQADSSGAAHYDAVLHDVGLSGANSVLGHSVVVHQNPDDYTTQPAGNSGPRIACGVIRPQH